MSNVYNIFIYYFFYYNKNSLLSQIKVKLPYFTGN